MGGSGEEASDEETKTEGKALEAGTCTVDEEAQGACPISGEIEKDATCFVGGVNGKPVKCYLNESGEVIFEMPEGVVGKNLEVCVMASDGTCETIGYVSNVKETDIAKCQEAGCPAGSSCGSDGLCYKTPEKITCAQTGCLPGYECGTDGYCSKAGNTPDGTDCVSDTDCLSGETCASDGTCQVVPAEPECSESKACTDPNQQCKGGICVAKDPVPDTKCPATPCPSGQTCQADGSCKVQPDPQCTPTSCPAGQQCGADGKCQIVVAPPSECTTNAQCGSSKKCVAQHCVPKVCGIDFCTDAGHTCDVSGACVAKTCADIQCNTSTQMCDPATLACIPDPSKLDADGDGVKDDKDQCANTPQGQTIGETGCKITATIKAQDGGDKLGLVRVDWTIENLEDLEGTYLYWPAKFKSPGMNPVFLGGSDTECDQNILFDSFGNHLSGQVNDIEECETSKQNCHGFGTPQGIFAVTRFCRHEITEKEGSLYTRIPVNEVPFKLVVKNGVVIKSDTFEVEAAVLNLSSWTLHPDKVAVTMNIDYENARDLTINGCTSSTLNPEKDDLDGYLSLKSGTASSVTCHLDPNERKFTIWAESVFVGGENQTYRVTCGAIKPSLNLKEFKSQKGETPKECGKYAKDWKLCDYPGTLAFDAEVSRTCYLERYVSSSGAYQKVADTETTTGWVKSAKIVGKKPGEKTCTPANDNISFCGTSPESDVEPLEKNMTSEGVSFPDDKFLFKPVMQRRIDEFKYEFSATDFDGKVVTVGPQTFPYGSSISGTATAKKDGKNTQWSLSYKNCKVISGGLGGGACYYNVGNYTTDPLVDENGKYKPRTATLTNLQPSYDGQTYCLFSCDNDLGAKTGLWLADPVIP